MMFRLSNIPLYYERYLQNLKDNTVQSMNLTGKEQDLLLVSFSLNTDIYIGTEGVIKLSEAN